MKKISCTFEMHHTEKRMIMILNDLIRAIDAEAPFALQESYDNSGIQVGSPQQEIKRGLVCLDVTPEVMAEAVRKKCDVVISHHPLIFKGLTRLAGETPAEQVVIEAIRHGIAVVAVHTNLDNIRLGVNHLLGTRLGLQNLRVLQPVKSMLMKLVTFCPKDHAGKVRAAMFRAGAGHIGDYDCCSFGVEGKGSFRAGDDTSPFVGKVGELHYEAEERIETILPVYLKHAVVAAMKDSHPYEEVAYDLYPLDNEFDQAGAGMLGDLPEAMQTEAFLQMVKETLGTTCLKHSRTGHQMIRSVALCGGSGAFLLPAALQSGAQAFVTGDVKYHQFFDATGKVLLVDAGHFETEQFARELLHDIVKKKMINFALLVSEVDTNPVVYY